MILIWASFPESIQTDAFDFVGSMLYLLPIMCMQGGD